MYKKYENPLNTIVDVKERNSMIRIWNAYVDAGQKCKDEELKETWFLLSRACAFTVCTRSGNGAEVFTPYFPGAKTCSIEAFSDGDLDYFSERLLSKGITHPPLAARLADILYCRRRDPQYARIALENYLAIDLDTSTLVDENRIYKRAELLANESGLNDMANILKNKLKDAMMLCGASSFPFAQYLQEVISESQLLSQEEKGD